MDLEPLSSAEVAAVWSVAAAAGARQPRTFVDSRTRNWLQRRPNPATTGPVVRPNRSHRFLVLQMVFQLQGYVRFPSSSIEMIFGIIEVSLKIVSHSFKTAGNFLWTLFLSKKKSEHSTVYKRLRVPVVQVSGSKTQMSTNRLRRCHLI